MVTGFKRSALGHKNMADNEAFSKHLQESLRELELLGFSGVKDEQRDTVTQLVKINGGKVFAVLPTGFGKSFISALFLKVKSKINGEKCACGISQFSFEKHHGKLGGGSG